MNKRELFKKLKALAEQGVGGEKENAQQLLKKFMRKYNVSEDEIDDDVLIEYEKKVKNEYEIKLFAQVFYKVVDGSIYTFKSVRSGRRFKNLLGYRCTAAQNIELEFLFDFYKRLFYKELDLLFTAFIQKHKLFGDSPKDKPDDKIDYDELLRIIEMMNALSDETPQLQIEHTLKT